MGSELAGMSGSLRARSLEAGLAAWDAMAAHAGCVREGPEPSPGGTRPDWIDLPLDEARVAAPDVHAALTSVQVRTGLWRTMRPVIDPDHCKRCHWLCGSLCPDGAISVDPEGSVVIDYDHCKGCMICVVICPPHAIHAVPEARACEEGEGSR
jgi:pyruvate ferredoxin oxidoreductase gamma subunit